MSYKIIYLSSQDMKSMDLNDKNHGQNKVEAVKNHFKFYHCSKELLSNSIAEEHNIQNWFDNETPRDTTMKPLDVVFILNDDYEESFWLPYVEYMAINKLRSISDRIFNFNWGYIDGRRHHLGCVSTGGMMASSMYDGYIMFLEGFLEKEF